jgi:hypothetical protein
MPGCEGGYTQMELAIHTLLSVQGPGASLPAPLPLARAEDSPGPACARTTPELPGFALGGPEPPSCLPVLFPPPSRRSDGRSCLEDLWRPPSEGLTLSGEHGVIPLPDRAATVNAVQASLPEPVEWTLDLHPPGEIRITKESRPDRFAEHTDRAEGQSDPRADFARRNAPVPERDEPSRVVRLNVPGPGLTLDASSVGACDPADRMLGIPEPHAISAPAPME